MTWASPKGGKAPVDDGSVTAYAKDQGAQDFLKTTDTFAATKKLSDMDPADFDAIFVVGGYGVMWDLVKNDDLKDLASKIYAKGGVVSGVCHGPAALVQVDDGALVKGKKVACFSNAEEDAVKRREVVDATCEDALNKAGAKYGSGEAWADYTAVDGNLITGQNPASAKSTAELVVKAISAPATQKKFIVGFDLSRTTTYALTGSMAFVVLAVAIVRKTLGTRRKTEEDTELLDASEEAPDALE